MRVQIFSRAEVESIVPRDVPHAFISVITPRDVEASLPITERTVAVHRLCFDDVDAPEQDMSEIDRRQAEDGHRGIIWFSDEMARDLAQFIIRHEPYVDVWVIHCDAGFSRSPGIGGAILKHFTGDDGWIFRDYCPNMRVYRKILNALSELAERTDQ